MSELRDEILKSNRIDFVRWWILRLDANDVKSLENNGCPSWSIDLVHEVPDDQELEELYARYLMEKDL